MVYRECLKFCSNDVIQRELDDIKKVHNNHRIRRFPNQECPSGRPDIMYSIPECYGKFLPVYFLTVLKTCSFWRFALDLNRVAFKILQVVFFLDGHDCKNHVDSVVIEQSIPYITKKSVFMCSNQFEKLALQIIIREDLRFPRNVAEARVCTKNWLK